MVMPSWNRVNCVTVGTNQSNSEYVAGKFESSISKFEIQINSLWFKLEISTPTNTAHW